MLEMLGHGPDETINIQIEQINQVTARYGVANLLTHPEPELSARRPWRDAYQEVISEMVGRDDLWIALPREISAWWRSRSEKIEQAWDL